MESKITANKNTVVDMLVFKCPQSMKRFPGDSQMRRPEAQRQILKWIKQKSSTDGAVLQDPNPRQW